MTVAARMGLSLTLSRMMDSMVAGVEKTGVLLHVVPTASCSSYNLTGPCIQKPELSLQCSLLLTGSMKGSLSPTTF